MLSVERWISIIISRRVAYAENKGDTGESQLFSLLRFNRHYLFIFFFFWDWDIQLQLQRYVHSEDWISISLELRCVFIKCLVKVMLLVSSALSTDGGLHFEHWIFENFSIWWKKTIFPAKQTRTTNKHFSYSLIYWMDEMEDLSVFIRNWFVYFKLSLMKCEVTPVIKCEEKLFEIHIFIIKDSASFGLKL